MKIPYIIVVGDKEEKEKNLAVRVKGDKKIKTFNLKKFIEHLKKEIVNRE
jgi:threonyl-tRNA synthetase